MKELKKPKTPKGGKRPGAGMPPGYRTKKTAAKRAAEAQVLEQASIDAARVMEHLARVAFSDIGVFWREDGTVKRPTELTPVERSCLASFEAVI